MAPKPDYLANKVKCCSLVLHRATVLECQLGVPLSSQAEILTSRIVSDDVANWQLNQNSKFQYNSHLHVFW